MASAHENELKAKLDAAGVKFLWQERDSIPKRNYAALYGVSKSAEPDFYLPGPDMFIEVKGQMTLHQVAKMLYLAAQPDYRYYVYQSSEEDWDPTIDPLVHVEQAPPDSRAEKVRLDFNRRFQQRELLHIAAHPTVGANVSRATAARLRAYVDFFERHLRQATARGLLA
jgi:hypothetical protein